MAGRTVYGVLSAIIENFEKTELATLVDSIMKVYETSSTGAAIEAEDLLPILHGAGKILLKCLPDGESLSLVFGKIAALPSMSRECFENEVITSGAWGGNVWTENPLTELAPLGGDFRTILTFLGTMLENAELEHAEAILAFANATTSTDPSAMEAMTSAMVTIAKLYSETLDSMGERSEDVAPALKSLLTFALGQDSYSTELSSNGDSYKGKITKVSGELDEEAFSSLLEVLELMADLDMENPDPDLMMEISAAMEAFSALQKSESSTYSFSYETSAPTGDSYPSPSVSKVEGETETPVEHVLSGIDMSGPGQGLATLSFEGIEYLFRYEVSDIDRKITHFEIQNENGYFSSDPSGTLGIPFALSEIDELSYRTTDGVTVDVPLEDLIGLDPAKDSGIFLLPLMEEGESVPSEYRAVPYQVILEA